VAQRSHDKEKIVCVTFPKKLIQKRMCVTRTVYITPFLYSSLFSSSSAPSLSFDYAFFYNATYPNTNPQFGEGQQQDAYSYEFAGYATTHTNEQHPYASLAAARRAALAQVFPRSRLLAFSPSRLLAFSLLILY
jgi:hypothetical protein